MSPRPFFDTARDIRRGQFLEDCAEELNRVVAAVEETGKPAKLTKLQRHDRALEDASHAVIERIKAESGATVIFGKPE